MYGFFAGFLLAGTYAAGNNHILIEKKLFDSGFKTQIKTLDYKERVNEIARIVSGDNISEISLENAAQMLEIHS